MLAVLLKNARIFDDDFQMVTADLSVRGDRIGEIGNPLPEEDSYDLSGCLIVPGFVDIHIHGCAGADTGDGTREAIAKMAQHLVTEGVTSFCPTTMTVSLPQIRSALAAVRVCMENPPEGAAVLGANMEGPYLSVSRRGAQKEEYVRKPDWREFRQIYDECGGIIRLVELAPEREDAGEFIRHASQYCTVSLAHTEADFTQAKAAFRQGMTHATHLFNAMPGVNHRSPGAAAAVLDDEKVQAEIICDGFHIAPPIVRLAFRLLGEDRSIVISDSMRAAGMPDGVSELGGQKVLVKNGQARLSDGTIAGSTTNLYEEFKNLLRFGIPLRQAIKSVTRNPAASIQKDSEIGSLKSGKIADLVVLDDSWNIKMVVAKGRIMWKSF